MALRPVVSIVVNDLKDFKIIKESERKRAFGHPQNYIFATQQA
jgi:chromosome segregation and condensation protein ScpB